MAARMMNNHYALRLIALAFYGHFGVNLTAKLSA